MSDNALKAASLAIKNALSSGSEPWGTRVRVSIAKSGTGYPYIIYFWAGGGHDQRTKKRDANLRFAVVCISDKFADAENAAERINNLLHNHGRQDNSTDYLAGSPDWDILSITEEDTIYLIENPADTIPIYRIGAYYRFIMVHT